MNRIDIDDWTAQVTAALNKLVEVTTSLAIEVNKMRKLIYTLEDRIDRLEKGITE